MIDLAHLGRGSLVREVEEELGLRVKVGSLIAEVTFRNHLQQYMRRDDAATKDSTAL